jgi:GNAT superfamily N-acetyltransferase
MSAAGITIRPIEAHDEPAWRALWQGYCRFYAVDLGEALTAYTWARILDPASPVHAIVASGPAGRVVGMANYIVHENTWQQTPVCYLEDLFVDPDARARGIGRAILDWLVSEARTRGWSRLYWMTKETNYRARGLYDQYAAHDEFVRYVVKPLP